ncbi:MAG: hypothetical protein ACTTKD_09385 [Peptoanaerobacter stomatis]|uniref:hypothetical protein n=1 Tax=Peptoanaerobacter stomatis TaxID=796937 RepID=UPI003FA15A5C
MISFIISVSSISPIFAECVSKERKERVKVGERCRTDSNGKERCKSIYELRVVAVETKCTDKIVINYYVHSDINGNVYMNGKQVGTNGKVTNMPINTDITGRMSEMGIDISTLEEALSKGTVNVVDARKSITNEQEYQESNIYKSNKSKTYEDWKKNLVSGNGVENLDTSNLKVGKDGKITGTVDFSIKENDGISLKRISEYPDPHKAITEFVGKEHHTMAKAIDNIGSGKAKAQNVNFFSLTVPITREYEKKVEKHT